MTEAVDIERERYISSGKASHEAKVYASGLLELTFIAEDARSYDAALSAGREAVGMLRTLVASDENEQPELVEALGHPSWSELFARQWSAAKAAADEALALDPTKLWIETNAVHTRMFGGERETARERYLANRGKQIEGQGAWEKVVLDDFAQFREAGPKDPLMEEIEKEFAGATQSPAN
jgi:hypothetical protein